MNIIKSVAVFGGSALGNEPEYVKDAMALGRRLAQKGIVMNYGAGQSGLIGTTAKICLSEGGKVVGYINDSLLENEMHRFDLTELKLYATLHERKAALIEDSDAFCILPGGLGTLDEATEVLVLKQVGDHDKPIVFYNKNGYWNLLRACVDSFIRAGFVYLDDAVLVTYADSVEAVFDNIGI